MTDGHKVGILLLDGSRIDIPVQHKLTAKELRDIVASHVNVQERDYFGLAFEEDGGIWHFLQLDKRVLDHDIPKQHGHMILNFFVQFYVESISLLSDSNTYEQFYLQAKDSLFRGDLECNGETFFRLTALVLQILYGDHTDDATSRSLLKRLNAFPTRIYALHPSVEFCESQVLSVYHDAKGLEKGEAVIEFLNLAESIPSYGTHFYEVKDKTDTLWWLGLSHKGISLYDFKDRLEPRKSYTWNQVNDISSSKQRITVDVLDSRRSSMTRRGFATTSVSYQASTNHRARVISNMANDHFNFYFGRKTNKYEMTPLREKSDVAYELTYRRHSFSKLPAMHSARAKLRAQASAKNLRGLPGSTELSTIEQLDFAPQGEPEVAQKVEAQPQLSPEEARALNDRLVAKQKDLVQAILEREAEMRGLMMQEFEMTGALCEDYQDFVSGGRHIKETSFVLAPELIKKASNQNARTESISQLEIEHAVLINMYAANKLKAKETKKKAYKIACKENLQKIKKLEVELHTLREAASDSGSLLSHGQGSSQCSLQDTYGLITGRPGLPTSSLALTDTSDSVSMQSSAASNATAPVMPMKHRFSQGSLPEMPDVRRGFYSSSQSSLPSVPLTGTEANDGPQRTSSDVLSSSTADSRDSPDNGLGHGDGPNPTQASRDSTLGRKTSSCPVAPEVRRCANGERRAQVPGGGDSGFISLHRAESDMSTMSGNCVRQFGGSGTLSRLGEESTLNSSVETRRGDSSALSSFAASIRRLSSSDGNLRAAAESRMDDHPPSKESRSPYWYEPRDLEFADSSFTSDNGRGASPFKYTAPRRLEPSCPEVEEDEKRQYTAKLKAKTAQYVSLQSASLRRPQRNPCDLERASSSARSTPERGQSTGQTQDSKHERLVEDSS